MGINAVTRLQKIVHKVFIDEGNAVVQEGEVGTAMFIVCKGLVRLEGSQRPPRVLSAGDSFGEEIVTGLTERYDYTVVAFKKRAILFVFEEEAFQQTFGPMPDVVDQVVKNACALL